jgi:hypothetical protein
MSIHLQSLIARAVDDENYVLVAILNFNSAFDVTSIYLLLKRLKIISLPKDVIDLITVLLENIIYYVSINGINSMFFAFLLGTVKGFILGPILHAVFGAPLLYFEFFFSLAGNTFILRIEQCRGKFIKDIKKISRTKWLRQSGLVTNQDKMEMYIFYNRDVYPVTIEAGTIIILPKCQINILGTICVTKLQWSSNLANCIHKANKDLLAPFKLILRFFTTKELLQFLTGNYYSILF